jgi:hypothetical protein
LDERGGVMEYKTEPELVLELIKEVGVHRLGNWDGCTCCRFRIRDVDVDISCGKGRDRGIWIYSGSLDYWDPDDPLLEQRLLQPVAEEIKRQIEEGDHRGPVPIHFHEWKNQSE